MLPMTSVTQQVNPLSMVPNGQSSTDPYSPYYGMPSIPSYIPQYNASTMALAPGLENQLNQIQMDPAALNAFKEQALRKGPSAWANLATNQQMAQEAGQRENAAKQASTQTAQAEDRLASSGGLSSGARERAATEGGKNYLNMSQDLGRQGNLNKLQIGINDESNRIQQLSQLPGMELQALNPALQKAGMLENANVADLGAQIAGNSAQNQYNQNIYNQQMQAWGANQQANATANSGKK